MNLFDFRQARNYCEWFRRATRGLCQDAKDRILAEIEDHYDETYREELIGGKNEDQAHWAAMAALGNPRHARKAFRRAYLTKAEYKLLKRFTFSRRLWDTPITEWILFGLIAGIAVVLGVAWCATEDRFVGTFTVILLWCILAGLAKSILKLSGIVDRRPKRVLGWCILISAVMLLLLATYAAVLWQRTLYVRCFLLCLISGSLFDIFRLGVALLKLGTDPGGNHETSR